MVYMLSCRYGERSTRLGWGENFLILVERNGDIGHSDGVEAIGSYFDGPNESGSMI
jgi:hypothetical protein